MRDGADRRARLARARLYLVTDARGRQGDLEGFLDAVLGAGVDIVQLREKTAEAGELLQWAGEFRRAADRHGALFFVNDRPDVARAAGADGVHVGQNDLPPAVTRQIVGDELLIGVSTHAAVEFASAPPEADYLCAGPVHATPTKPGRPATGLDLIRTATAREANGEERRPWFAIGGIDQRTIGAVLDAGARRVVVVRAITESNDPRLAVHSLIDAIGRIARP